MSSVLGIRVDAGSLAQTTKQLLDDSVLSVKGRFICVANVHMVVSARRDEKLKKIMSDAYKVVSDGMPLVWYLNKLNGVHASRVAGPDLVHEICQNAQSQNLRVYFFGGSPVTAERLKDICKVRYPDLKVVGIESPGQISTNPALDFDAINRINNSNADLVFVGLGCPKQEYWMSVHAPHLNAILIGVGAAFDFLGGNVKRAPIWMQKNGLEWFFRLLCEPGRLGKRYLSTNIPFLWLVLLEIVRKKTPTHKCQ